MVRELVSSNVLRLPICFLPRPGESVVWYSDSTRRTGSLVGQDPDGHPIVQNEHGFTHSLDSYDQIRLVDPNRRNDPNWANLGPRAVISRPLAEEHHALQRLLKRHIPPGPTYLELIEEIWNRGFEVFLVGGTVRDVIAGLQPHDVDLVTSMPLGRAVPLLTSMYRNEPSIHKQKGFVRLGGTPQSGDPFIDLKAMIHSEPGTPNAIFSSDLTTDLRHRDFACNAIYYDPINNAFIDVAGCGIEGAEGKLLDLVCDSTRPAFYRAQICLRFFKFTGRGFASTDATATTIRDTFLPTIPAMKKSDLAGYVKAQLLSKSPADQHERILEELRASMVSFGAEDIWRQHFEPIRTSLLKRGK